MATPRPEIFISATSADLGTCRQVAKEAILTLGCVPIEQTNFPPSASSVREMLREKIASCAALVHIAGECYGAEPKERAAGEPRRSYTQMEYDIAMELKKPVYVFVCGRDFPYDAHGAEPEDLRALQDAHRQKLQSGDHLFTSVADRHDLDKRVLALQTRVEVLSSELKRSRRWLGWGVAAAIAMILICVCALWAGSRSSHSDEQLVQIRDMMDALSSAYVRGQRETSKLRLTDAELYERALQTVANEQQIPIAKLKTEIDQFVTAVRTDNSSDYMDRARADFADKRYSSAAENARLAAKAAQERKTARENEAADERREEYNALLFQAHALSATYDFETATQVLDEAISLVDNNTDPIEWALLHIEKGNVLFEKSQIDHGERILTSLSTSIREYNLALTLITKESDPANWARIQNDLGTAHAFLSGLSSGDAKTKELSISISYYKKSLEILSRETSPMSWAFCKNNLGTSYWNLSKLCEPSTRYLNLCNAIESYKCAIAVRTRKDSPLDWSTTQNNIGLALSDMAISMNYPQQDEYFDMAIHAYDLALEVRTRIDYPRYWATTLNNKGIALWHMSRGSNAEDNINRLLVAVSLLQQAMEVRTRERYPQDWANSQNNLGLILSSLARNSTGKESLNYYRQAIDAYHNSLEVRTREAMPYDWLNTTNNLLSALQYFALKALQMNQTAIAKSSVDEALLISPADLRGLIPLADCYLLSGQYDKAAAIYRAHALEKLDGNNDKPFAQVCLDDFAELRKAGIDTPDMTKAEALLKELLAAQEPKAD